MAEDLDPVGAANVFTAQLFALMALANALVEAGAVNGEALIEALLAQRQKFAEMKTGPKFLVPLDAMIRAIRREEARRTKN